LRLRIISLAQRPSSSLLEAIRAQLGLEVIAERLSFSLPESAYDRARGQYDAAALLELLRALRSQGELLLLLLQDDIYAGGLNYCFGLASEGIAVVSTRRLDPSYYGEAANPSLLEARLLKEVVHEAGHMLGLGHCSARGCIMRFSRHVRDTDEKGPGFCPACRRRLQLLLHEGRKGHER